MIDYVLMFLGVLLACPGVMISQEYSIHHQCRTKSARGPCPNHRNLSCENGTSIHVEWSRIGYSTQWTSVANYMTCNVTNTNCYKEIHKPTNKCTGSSSCTINGCSGYMSKMLSCAPGRTNYVRINYTCISAPSSDDDFPWDMIIIVAVAVIFLIIIIVLGVILSEQRKKRKSNKKDIDIEDNDRSSVHDVADNNHAVKGEYGTTLVDNTDYVTSDDVITADIIAEINGGKSKINSTIGSDFVENSGYAGYGEDVDSGLTRMKAFSSRPRRPMTLYPVLDITDGTDIVDNEGYISVDDAPKLVTQVSVKLDKPAAPLPGGVISEMRNSGSDNYADIDLDNTHPGIQPENGYDEIDDDGNDDVDIIDTSMDPDYELAGAISVDPEFAPAKRRLELTKSDYRYEDYKLNSDSGSSEVDATPPYTETDGELFSSQKPIKPPKPTSPKPKDNPDGTNIDKTGPQLQASPSETLARQTGPFGDDYTMVIKHTE